jgi:plastocyanin
MKRFSIALIGAAVILTGCSSAAPTPTVAIATFRFAPETITVPSGTTVTWINEDATRHTVTAGTEDQTGDLFDEEVDEVGDEVTVKFDEPGTYEYFCVLHPFMTGLVEVTG